MGKMKTRVWLSMISIALFLLGFEACRAIIMEFGKSEDSIFLAHIIGYSMWGIALVTSIASVVLWVSELIQTRRGG